MEYYKIETNEIITDIEGTAQKAYENVYGEIVKIKVVYGECNEQTNIQIITSEGETLDYTNNNKDFIIYPRHPTNASQFQSLDLEAGEEERYINCGNLYIQISEAAINENPGIIKNIIIVLRK